MENNRNSNSLYRNALPQLIVLPLNESKLDFWKLNYLDSEMTVQMIAKIIKQESFEIGINLSSLKAGNQENIQHLERIQHTFLDLSMSDSPIVLGYPLLLLEDTALGRDIAAPLFYWEIELRNADDDNQQHWVISYSAGNAKFNDILKNYLVARYAIDWDELMGSTDNLRNKELLSALERLAQALNLENPQAPKLFACPEKENEWPFKNGFLWSAFLGRQKEEQQSTLPLTLQPKNRRSWFTGVGSLSLNSIQESALNDLFDGHDVLVYGPADSGKTRTAAAFIPALMSDGGSCLYLSSDQPTQVNLGITLDKLGLKESGVWFVDSESSAIESLLYQISKLPERSKKLPKFDDKAYNLSLQQFLLLREKLSARFDAIQKPMLEGTDWTNMVGRFLKNHRVDGKQYLSRILDTADYKWSFEEYYRLLNDIKESGLLFAPILSLQHPLTLLQDYIFLEKNEDNATDWVKENVLTFTKLLRELYRKYTTFIDSYADDFRFHYEGHVKELKNRIENIRRDIRVYEGVYGNSFDFSDGFTKTRLRILSVFSKRSGQILAAKEDIYNSYEELKAIYLSKKYFEHNLQPFSKYLNLTDISKDLEAFETAADAWFLRIPKIVKQKIKELTLKMPLKPEFKQRFLELEEQVDDFFVKLQESVLFKPLEKPKSQKATERETQLRALLEQLTEVESQLPMFKNFYNWRKHWLGLTDASRNLISALIAVRPQGWETAYKSWYYYHYLDKNYSLHLPETDYPLQNYMQLQSSLRENVAKNALINVREHQAERLEELKKEQNFVPAKISAKFNDVKLKDLVEELGIELITELFPLIVIRPEMADKIFRHKVAYFDTIVMDDAQLLDTKMGRKLSKLGAQRLVMGRKEEAPNYLNAMLDSGFTKIYPLDSIYSKDGKVISKICPSATVSTKKELRDELFSYLSDYINAERLEKAVKIDEEIELDIVINPINANAPKIALLLDGWLKQVKKYDVDAALQRSTTLKAAGYNIYPIWSMQWWRNPDAAAEELVTYILNNDLQTSK
jgi:hypothetical protein